MDKSKAVIALSGGMDSTTLLYWAVDTYSEVLAISFDYGQNHIKEIEFAKWHCKNLNIPHEIIEIPFLSKISKSSLTGGADEIPEGMYDADNMKSTVVPFRNGIILAILGAYAEANNCQFIAYGAHAGDHAIYPDCRKEFVDDMSAAISNGTYTETIIETPFVKLTKSELLTFGSSGDIDYSKTWSCYKGKERPCLKCGTCVERTEAFLDNKLKDPLLTNGEWKEAVDNYARFKYESTKD